MVTASADLLVDRLPVDKADLGSGEDRQVKCQQSPYNTTLCRAQEEEFESQRLYVHRHTWN